MNDATIDDFEVGWADYFDHTKITLSKDFNGRYRATCMKGGVLVGPTMATPTEALMAIGMMIERESQ